MRQRYVQGPGPWCGTAGGYTNHGCRCQSCTDAFRVAHRAYMDAHPEQREKERVRQERWRRAQGMKPQIARVYDPRCPLGYGSRTGYVKYGCRCDPCRESHNGYIRDWRRARRAAQRSY